MTEIPIMILLTVRYIGHNNCRTHGSVGTYISMFNITGKSVKIAGLQRDTFVIRNTQY